MSVTSQYYFGLKKSLSETNSSAWSIPSGKDLIPAFTQVLSQSLQPNDNLNCLYDAIITCGGVG